MKLAGPGLTICGRADVEQVVQLVNAAYRGLGGQSGWTSEMGLVDGLRITAPALRRDLAAAAEPTLFLWREAGELLACVRLDSGRGRDDLPAGHISMLAVRPDRQDRGLGAAMLDHAESQASARGARIAHMSVVSVRTSLIAWYERHGYRRTGEREPFPYRDAPFGQPQLPGLEFIVLEKPLPP